MRKLLKTACGFETDVSHLDNFRIQAMIDSMNETVVNIDTTNRGQMVIITAVKEERQNGDISKVL